MNKRIEVETFEVKDEHLKLLKRAYVRWEGGGEYGAPAINSKRPYGNSDVDCDIADILGWEYDEDDGLTGEQVDKAQTLHEETQIALQIALATQKFETGVYENYQKYHKNKWRKVQLTNKND